MKRHFHLESEKGEEKKIGLSKEKKEKGKGILTKMTERTSCLEGEHFLFCGNSCSINWKQ